MLVNISNKKRGQQHNSIVVPAVLYWIIVSCALQKYYSSVSSSFGCGNTRLRSTPTIADKPMPLIAKLP